MIHWASCMLLTFGPGVIMYRSTRLAEERAFSSCFQAGVLYACTQMAKIFLLATFLPGVDIDADKPVDDSFVLTQEALKTIANVVDLVGVHLTLQLVPNLSKYAHSIRILTVGLGWAFSQSTLNYLAPLWIGARGVEFSWKYLEMGVASNIDSFLNTGFVAAVWLRSRTDLELKGVPFVLASLACFILLPSVRKYLAVVVGLDTWTLLAFRAAVAAAMALSMRWLVLRYENHRVKRSD